MTIAIVTPEESRELLDIALEQWCNHLDKHLLIEPGKHEVPEVLKNMIGFDNV